MTPEDFRKDYLYAITLACDLGNKDGVINAVMAAQQGFSRAIREERERCARIVDGFNENKDWPDWPWTQCAAAIRKGDGE
jgi:hypothetical protein